MLKKYFPNRPWLRRGLLTSAVLLLVYLVGGFLIVPLCVTWFAPGVVNGIIKGSIEMGSVGMNPLTFRVSVNEFVLKDPEGEAVLGFEHFRADAGLLQTLFGTITVDEIRLRAPMANIVIAEDGSINLLEAIALENPAEPEEKPTEPKEPLELPAAFIRILEVVDGEISFTDDSVAEQNGGQPFAVTVTPANFLIEDFSTDPERENPYALAIGSEGTFFQTSGTLQFDPISIDGTVSGGFDQLKGVQAYIDHLVNFAIGGGAFTFSGAYHFEPLNEPRQIGLSEGTFSLRDFVIDGKEATGGTNRFYELPSVEVVGASVDLLGQTATIESIAVDGVNLKAVRLADGSIDLLSYLLPPVSEGESSPPSAPDPEPPEGEGTAPAEPLRIGVLAGGRDVGEAIQAALDAVAALDPEKAVATLHAFDLANATLRLEDQSFGDPIQLNLEGASLALRNATNQKGASITIEAATKISDHTADTRDATASLGVVASLFPTPTAEIKFGLEGLEVEAFSAIVESFIPVAVKSLTVGAAGSLSVALPAETLENGVLPPVTLTLDTTATDFALQPLDDEEPLVTYDAFSIESLVANTQPLGVTIDTIRLVNPSALAERLEDGELAVMKLLPKAGSNDDGSASEDAPESSEPTEPAELPEVKIRQIIVEGGHVRVYDAAVSPVSNFAVSDIQVAIRDFDLKSGSPTSLSYSALIAEEGVVKVNGTLIPLDLMRDTAIETRIDGLPLATFSPYSIDAIGRPIRTGKFSGVIPLKIQNSELDLLKELNIRRLRFDSAVEGKPTIDLPIGTAIALLEDTDGVIYREIPIKGNVNNPNFKIEQLIIQEIRAAIINATTSPLKLIGTLAATGDDAEDGPSLEFASFKPGTAELTDQGQQTLKLIGEGLKKRPQIGLVLVDSVDPDSDFRALRESLLEAKLAEVSIEPGEDPLFALYREYFPNAAVPATEGVAPSGTPDDAAEPDANPGEPEAVQPSPTSRPVRSGEVGPGVVVTERRRVDQEKATVTVGTRFFDHVNPLEQRRRETSEGGAQTSEPVASTTAPLNANQMRARLLRALELPEGTASTLGQQRKQTALDFLLQNADLKGRITMSDNDAPLEAGASVTFEIKPLLD